MSDEFAEKHIYELETELADKEKELYAMQTILGMVLHKIGEPMVITHEEVVNGLPDGTQIFIDEDPQSLEHTLGIVYPTVDNAE